VVEWIEVHVPDTERARALYRGGLAWHPNDLQRGATDVKIYFTIDDLAALIAKVRELGGTAGEPYVTGPGRASDCTDDQGTRFSLWQEITDR
jgi:predicted enzyme related to lactoylglutathione lyase